MDAFSALNFLESTQGSDAEGEVEKQESPINGVVLQGAPSRHSWIAEVFAALNAAAPAVLAISKRF